MDRGSTDQPSCRRGGPGPQAWKPSLRPDRSRPRPSRRRRRRLVARERATTGNPVIMLTARTRSPIVSAASRAAPTITSLSRSIPTSWTRASRPSAPRPDLARRAPPVRPNHLARRPGLAFIDGQSLQLMPREFEVLGLLLGRAPRLLPNAGGRCAGRAQPRPRRQRRRGLCLAPASQARRLGRDDKHAARLRLRPRGRRRARTRDAGPRRARWLTVDLLLRLLLPLLVIVATIAGSGPTPPNGSRPASSIAGCSMRRAPWRRKSASSTAPRPRSAADRRVDLLFDDNDRVYFSVSQGGRLIAGSAASPSPARTKRESRVASPTMRDSTASRCGSRG